MKDNIRINPEYLLYGLAIIVALFVRLIGLGALPLDDAEARLALNALELARGQADIVQGSPLYVLLTGGLFFFSHANEALARLWPAILGGLLPLAAFFLRGSLGKRPALILAFGLALDPGMLAVSRQVNGDGIAVFVLLLAAGMAVNGRSLGVGFFAGLGLLGGASIWPGIFALGIVYLIVNKLFVADKPLSLNINWKQITLGAMIALGSVGTLLMTAPIGIGGIGNSLVEYFSGWQKSTSGSTDVIEMLIILLVYHGFPMIFGLIGIVRAIKESEDHLGRGLSILFLLSLFLIFVYPSRQVFDLIWCLVPLWILAARELARVRLEWRSNSRIELGYALLVIVLIVFLQWSLASFPNPDAFMTDLNRQSTMFRFLAGLALFLMTFGLVVWGWGLRTAAQGLRLGIAVSLFFGMVSSMWNAAGMTGMPESEMWRSGNLPKEAGLMETTLNDLSEWRFHSPGLLDVSVVGLESDSLHWILRDYRDVRYMSVIAAGETPSIVITPAQISPAQATAYRGQDFIWGSKPAWSSLTFYEFVRWVELRQVRTDKYYLILWVRSDIFPGSASE